MPNKRWEVKIRRGSEKSRNLVKGGSKEMGGSEFKKRLTVIVKWWKKHKQVAIKHKTKIHTEARYFALKSGPG